MIKLCTDKSHDLDREIDLKYKYSHYEVCGKTPVRYKGVMLDDNLHNIVVDEDIRQYLLDKFRINKSDVVLELGAYYGFGTVKLSQLANKIITVEADKYNYRMVQKNLKANNVNNVTVINKAVGKEAGIQLFYSQKGDLGQQKSLHKGPLTGIKSSYEVKVDTVDNILAGTKVDFITIEVNLGEVDALLGMSETLSHSNIRLLAAGWYEYNGKPACLTMKDILEGHGFSVYIGVKNRVYAIKE